MNPVIHFEMPYHDAKRAAKFYEAVFGWKTNFLGEESGHYLLVTTAEKDAYPDQPRGAIQGGLFPFNPDWPLRDPSIVIGVEDIQAAMNRIKKSGGELLGEPMTIPEIGKYVSFTDTEGNRNSILQPVDDGWKV